MTNQAEDANTHLIEARTALGLSKEHLKNAQAASKEAFANVGFYIAKSDRLDAEKNTLAEENRALRLRLPPISQRRSSLVEPAPTSTSTATPDSPPTTPEPSIFDRSPLIAMAAALSPEAIGADGTWHIDL